MRKGGIMTDDDDMMKRRMILIADFYNISLFFSKRIFFMTIKCVDAETHVR